MLQHKRSIARACSEQRGREALETLVSEFISTNRPTIRIPAVDALLVSFVFLVHPTGRKIIISKLQ